MCRQNTTDSAKTQMQAFCHHWQIKKQKGNKVKTTGPHIKQQKSTIPSTFLG